MLETKNIYTCNRCGEIIDSLFFEFDHGLFKKTISATEYEQVKYGYLSDDMVPLPDADVIVLEGVCGYKPKDVQNIHFCKKCTKEFRIFMKRGNNYE